LPKTTISDLKRGCISPTLWYRIHVLLYDLENFDSSPASQKRLGKIGDPSYIGRPYFTREEAEIIKRTRIDVDGRTETIEQMIDKCLEEREKFGCRISSKRPRSGDLIRVSASQQVASTLAGLLGIDLVMLGEDRTFVNLMVENGLFLEGVRWTGLKKRFFVSRKKR
ncbi:uncharacterized protein BO97DRAFT_331631, partial [Aspergillus homomorphus CBS 101889]